MKNGTTSQNIMWLKVDKYFFGLQEDLYVCAIYIPPATSNYFENDTDLLENEISFFSAQGKILLMGDLNSRCGCGSDFIVKDSTEINNFDASDLLPNFMRLILK